MADAPTTEEVRAGLAQAEREDRAAARAYSGGPNSAAGYEMALAISEHRDRLAAEVRALRADLARVSEELGLPPSIGPAPGELRRLLAEARRAGAEAFKARVVAHYRAAAKKHARDGRTDMAADDVLIANEIEAMSVEEGGEDA